MLGLTSFEQGKLTTAMMKRLELERLLDQHKKSGKPLDDAAVQALKDQTEATIALANAEADRRRMIERSAGFGANKAFQNYVDDATNSAKQVEDVFTNAFKGMEDALVSFITTGKLDFTSLANSIVADITRMIVKQQIMAPLMQMISGGGGTPGNNPSAFVGGGSGGFLGGLFKGLLGFAGGGDPPVGVPSWVGEHGPELFVPKAAGTIVPNSVLASNARAPGNVVNINVNQTFAPGTTRATTLQAAADARRQLEFSGRNL